MKKIISLLLVGIITICSVLSTCEVKAQLNEETTYYDWKEIFEAINSVDWASNNHTEYVGNYIIECSKEVSNENNARSVFQNTKTETRTLTITDRNSATCIVTLSQTVTYVVNEIEGTVKINAYSTTIDNISDGYRYEVCQDAVISNALSTQFAIARKAFVIYNPIGESCTVDCSVTVYKTGQCDFTFAIP